jgi:hypothetical protein
MKSYICPLKAKLPRLFVINIIIDHWHWFIHYHCFTHRNVLIFSLIKCLELCVWYTQFRMLWKVYSRTFLDFRLSWKCYTLYLTHDSCFSNVLLRWCIVQRGVMITDFVGRINALQRFKIWMISAYIYFFLKIPKFDICVYETL